MDFYDVIEKRYSCRSYRKQEVEEDKLLRVLDAGRFAPSGRNLQNWKFIVVRKPDRRRELVEACDQDWMKTAPVIIAVVTLEPERTMYCDIPAGPVDCAIAEDHMTLAATAEGLGTCWVGHFDQDKCRDILSVPDGAKIIELMTLGYPADSPRAKHRKDRREVVCYETFSE
ncbi:MAG: nitroreductase family protein [Phycisphaerae bacterium]